MSEEIQKVDAKVGVGTVSVTVSVTANGPPEAAEDLAKAVLSALRLVVPGTGTIAVAASRGVVFETLP